MPVRFELTTLLVDDVARMKAFYRDAFGFAVATDGDRYVELDAGGTRLALYPRSAFASLTHERARPGISVTLGFHCADPEDVRATFTHAVEQGARVVKLPDATGWGRFAAFLADPEGHVIELSCAMTHASL
jgi:catechol 2,3-dioxygenase-like lactoylglutathione lyase family enzyme